MTEPAALKIVTRPVPDGTLTDAPENLPPLLERIYLSRGLTSGHELDRNLSALARPGALPEIDKAAERLARAGMSDEHILIVATEQTDGNSCDRGRNWHTGIHEGESACADAGHGRRTV